MKYMYLSIFFGPILKLHHMKDPVSKLFKMSNHFDLNKPYVLNFLNLTLYPISMQMKTLKPKGKI